MDVQRDAERKMEGQVGIVRLANRDEIRGNKQLQF